MRAWGWALWKVLALRLLELSIKELMRGSHGDKH